MLFPYQAPPPNEVAMIVDTDYDVSALTTPSGLNSRTRGAVTEIKLRSTNPPSPHPKCTASDTPKAVTSKTFTRHQNEKTSEQVNASHLPSYKQQVDSRIAPNSVTAIPIYTASTVRQSQSSNSGSQNLSKSTRCIGILLVLLVLVTGPTIGVVCGVLGHCRWSDRSSNDNEKSNNVVAFINSITFSTTPLTYPSTARAEEAALKWLLDQDPQQLSQDNVLHLRQRYALATLYFSGSWVNDDNRWLSDSSECDWAGIDCTNAQSVTMVNLTEGITGGGPIPADIALLTNLRVLQLFNNKHTGTIPTSLGSLVLLDTLEINENRLTGTIPTELGQVETLFSLSLFGNLLESTIPTELGNLSNLFHLALSDSFYSGIVPTQLGQLTNLQHLFVHNNNRLGGSLDFMCARNLVTLVADCDIVVCSCCTFCCVQGGYGGIPEYAEEEGWCKN
jgi:hypothetical protein